MKRFTVNPLVLALATSCTSLAWAADETTLPDLNVVSKRDLRNQAGYAVDLQDGRADGLRDTAGLLEQAPGAAVLRNGSQTGIVQLRGMNGDRVNVQVDGMHISPACPNHMDPPLHYATADSASVLEVLAGVTPVSMGGDSIAGTVRLQSAPPHFGSGDALEVFGKASAGYVGANNGRNAMVQLGTANSQNSLSYTGERQTGDDLKIPGGGRVKDTGYELTRHDLLLARQTEHGVLQLDLGKHISRNAGTPSLPMDMVKDDADRYSASYQGQYEFGTVETRLYRHEITHLMDNYTLRDLSSGMIAPATSNDTGFQLNVAMPHGSDTYRVGTEYLVNDFDAYSQSSNLSAASIKDIIRNGKRSRLGVYGEWESQLGADWKTLLGLRSDTVRSNADAVTNLGMGAPAPVVADAALFNGSERNLTDRDWDLTAQARYRASESADYELAVARKTRSPSLVERYLWSPSSASAGMADNRTYLGNLDLKPEVSTQLSVGANWHADNWQVKPSLFYNRVADYIQGTPIARTDSSGNAVLQYNNIQAELYGLDGSWLYRMADNVSLSGTLSYVRGKRTDADDNLYRIAPLRASVNAEYTVGQWMHRIEWLVAAAQNNVSTYNGETETPGYATLNLRTRYQVQKNLKISAGIENLFDRYYVDHLGGINRVAGSDVPVGQHIPGAGRFVYVTGEYRF